MTYKEQFNKIIPLIEELYEKYPAYVSFSFTLRTEKNGNCSKSCVKYNIYTPEISHNDYDNFEGFVCYIERLLKDGVKKVRLSILKDRLERLRTEKNNAIDEIRTIESELEKLETDPL